MVIGDENTPLGLWHVIAARGDARPPRIATRVRRVGGVPALEAVWLFVGLPKEPLLKGMGFPCPYRATQLLRMIG